MTDSCVYGPYPGSLVDWELNAFARQGHIEPFRAGQLNPASYNLRIGTTAIIEAKPHWSLRLRQKLLGGHITGSRQHGIDLSCFTAERPLWVSPGQLVLVDVAEWINIPPTHEALVLLRSSAGRRGWDHALSGYVDPGYSGRLTLELVNCLRWESLPLFPGQMLMQLRVYRLGRKPIKPYHLTGRYCNARAVQASLDEQIG